MQLFYFIYIYNIINIGHLFIYKLYNAYLAYTLDPAIVFIISIHDLYLKNKTMNVMKYKLLVFNVSLAYHTFYCL